MLANPNGTLIDVSDNNLNGPYPAVWSARASSWKAVGVARNPRMCGGLPAWFNATFGGNATAMYAGALCEPMAGLGWDQLLCLQPCGSAVTATLQQHRLLRCSPPCRHANAITLLAAA